MVSLSNHAGMPNRRPFDKLRVLCSTPKSVEPQFLKFLAPAREFMVSLPNHALFRKQNPENRNPETRRNYWAQRNPM